MFSIPAGIASVTTYGVEILNGFTSAIAVKTNKLRSNPATFQERMGVSCICATLLDNDHQNQRIVVERLNDTNS